MDRVRIDRELRRDYQDEGIWKWFDNILGRGYLDDYELRFTRHSQDGGKADIVQCPSRVTEGKLYNIPVQAVVDYLYIREGVQYGIYRPLVLPIRLENGEVIDALSYEVMDKESQELAPSDDYRKEILRGARGNNPEETFLSEGYCQWLENKIDLLKKQNNGGENKRA